MRAYKTAPAIALVAVLITNTGNAQTLKRDDGPAEIPPASYTAGQYVDSKGCVYIRAGYAGNVEWIPRVSRERKLLCGFTPTFAAGAPQQTAVAKPQEPVQITIPEASEPASTKPASAPVEIARPDPVTVVPAGACGSRELVSARYTDSGAVAVTCGAETAAPVAVPTPAPVETPRVAAIDAVPADACGGREILSARYNADGQLAVRCAAPLVAAVPIPAPSATPIPKPAATGAPACEGLSDLSAQYVNSGDKYPVRCGPQEEGTFPGQPALPPQSSVIAPVTPVQPTVAPRPKALALTVRPAAPAPQPRRVVEPPEGYKVAWEDDRLNPNRGKGTAEGEATMNMVWTQTVPRRLVLPDAPQYSVAISTKSQPEAKPKVRVSTKSVPVAKPASQKPAATGARYVQVGLFGDPANASATVARMQALGLPVRQGTVRSKGRVLQTIMVGPVAPDSAPRVLANIRKAGYGDAYLR
jgi:hypothetical protein